MNLFEKFLNQNLRNLGLKLLVIVTFLLLCQQVYSNLLLPAIFEYQSSRQDKSTSSAAKKLLGQKLDVVSAIKDSQSTSTLYVLSSLSNCGTDITTSPLWKIECISSPDLEKSLGVSSQNPPLLFLLDKDSKVIFTGFGPTSKWGLNLAANDIGLEAGYAEFGDITEWSKARGIAVSVVFENKARKKDNPGFAGGNIIWDQPQPDISSLKPGNESIGLNMKIGGNSRIRGELQTPITTSNITLLYWAKFPKHLNEGYSFLSSGPFNSYVYVTESQPKFLATVSVDKGKTMYALDKSLGVAYGTWHQTGYLMSTEAGTSTIANIVNGTIVEESDEFTAPLINQSYINDFRINTSNKFAGSIYSLSIYDHPLSESSGTPVFSTKNSFRGIIDSQG